MTELSPEARNLIDQHNPNELAERVVKLDDALAGAKVFAIELKDEVQKWKNEANRLYGVGQEIEELRVDQIARFKADNTALRQQIKGLREFVVLFTLEDLRGTFNHYMEMQKQAVQGQGDEITISFWKKLAVKQLKIIEAFEAIKVEGK